MFENLTAKYANGSHNPNVKGRDMETRRIFLTLLRYEKPNVLLLGPAGVGKTSLINQIAYLIANKLCPPSLFGYVVISVNTTELIAGDGYRGVIEQKFTDMIKTALAKDGKCILFFDEFHTVYNLGRMANDSTPGLGNTLKPYMTSNVLKVIGATTTKELEQIKDPALLRRMSKQYIGEPDDTVLLEIIRTCFKKFIGKDKISVEDGVVQQILDLSKSIDGINPDKAKDIVDVVVADAKLNEQKRITTVAVSLIFDIFYLKVQKEPEAADNAIFEEKEPSGENKLNIQF